MLLRSCMFVMQGRRCTVHRPDFIPCLTATMPGACFACCTSAVSTQAYCATYCMHLGMQCAVSQQLTCMSLCCGQVCHTGDALGDDAVVQGGFAGIVVDLFAEGQILPALCEVKVSTVCCVVMAYSCIEWHASAPLHCMLKTCSRTWCQTFQKMVEVCTHLHGRYIQPSEGS